MIIGVLAIGIVAGLASAGLALGTGGTVLFAVACYALSGTAATLLAVAFAAYREVHVSSQEPVALRLRQSH